MVESQAELQARIRAAYGEDLNLVLTRNRSTFISFFPGVDQFQPGRLRLHECFLGAPDEVVQAVARFMRRSGRDDARLVREYAESRMKADGGTAGRRFRRLRSRGLVHNLHDMLQQVIEEHFPDKDLSAVRITYGQGSMRMGPRRSIHYGSYHFATRTITIHPILDSPTVPDWFVRFVIFHELIHAVLPEPVMVNGRRKIHDPQFRQMEESHPDYDRAGAFAQEFLRRFR